MQTLKIEIPDGYVIESFDQQSGQIKFKEKPKKVTDRIRTVDDVLADNGITRSQFDQKCEGLEEHVKAYMLLTLLCKSLNDGWQPDWNNSSEYKYYAWFWMGGSGGFRFYGYDCWFSYSLVGSRLCFSSRELAEHAGKHFTDVYKKFMVIE